MLLSIEGVLIGGRDFVARSLVASETQRVELRLKGGLGNQLFQWSAADRIAVSLGGRVEIDVSHFAEDPYKRMVHIGRICDVSVINDPDVSGGAPSADVAVISESPEFLELVAGLEYTCSRSLPFRRLIVDGYWQDSRIPNEVQCEAISASIEKILLLSYSGWLRCLTSAKLPVGFHVRRSDYLHHGVADPSFYICAAQAIRKQASDAVFFVFSDEPNFCEWLFGSNGIPIRIVNTGDDVADLGLLSRCSVHVLSNSTFSWWGARLSRSRRVVVPLPWSFIHTPSEHLLPKHWVSVEGVVKSLTMHREFSSRLDHSFKELRL